MLLRYSLFYYDIRWVYETGLTSYPFWLSATQNSYLSGIYFFILFHKEIGNLYKKKK